jgi:hypothetical protein
MSESMFDVEGERLEVPVWDSFGWDEAQFVYDRTGYAIEDFVVADPDASEAEQLAHEKSVETKVKNPALKRALVAIAYVRAHPDAKYDEVFDGLGGKAMLDAFAELAGEDSDAEDEPRPPDEEGSTSEPSESYSEENPDSNESFGTDSSITSDEPDEPLEAIGVTR